LFFFSIFNPKIIGQMIGKNAQTDGYTHAILANSIKFTL